MKTIVWDVDDVLNDLMREWIENWSRPARPGCTIAYHAITKNPPPRVLGISLEEYRKPLDEDAILRAARETNLTVTAEEHSAVGGLGSAVAEVLAAQPNRHCPLLTLNLGDKPPRAVGSATCLRRELGIDSSGIARAVRE